jgi:drug/metabolite transporter (DMT)-like permease
MTGAALALLAAMAYGVAGVSITQGKTTATGDNGVFHSVLMTASLSFAIWVFWGLGAVAGASGYQILNGIVIFAFAGILSNVLGRQLMYRATERIGAVQTGLLRRLTPLFALPAAFLILNEIPTSKALLGGALVLFGVIFYLRPSSVQSGSASRTGISLGVGSALFYALSYSFRGLGLTYLPDAALGTFVGAITACIWLSALEVRRKGWPKAYRELIADTGLWQVTTAIALSIGQILQFFALNSTTVLVVAVLGALDVLFAAAIIYLIKAAEPVAYRRLPLAFLFALAGTALIVAV